MLFIHYITWLYCFCAGVETSTAQATMSPTTFQSLLQHTQVFHDQCPLPKQLHTPVMQPEPSYHLLSHQDSRQPSSHRHESDIPPVGPRQEEVTSQGDLWGSWQSFAFLSACFSAVLACPDTLIMFLLIYFVIDYCYLHWTCCTIICVLRCWPLVWTTRSNSAPSISRYSKSYLCSHYYWKINYWNMHHCLQ